MSTRLLITFFLIVCFAIIICNGCGKKEGDEPTKYRSQAGLEKLTLQAQSAKKDNPLFGRTADSNAKAPETKDLDSAIRPVLKNLFGDARMVSESNSPQTEPDGEVVENRFVYSVKKHMVPEDGNALHAALHSAGFGLSPRLGSKPSIGRSNAVMSLFKSTSRRSYSLVINIDTKKQQIIVESYRLGSKYDRLM